MIQLDSGAVIGLKELQAKFKAMADEFSGEIRAEIAFVGAERIAEAVRGKIVQQDLVKSGQLLDSVEAYKINQWTAGVRVMMPYAAVHEYGLKNQIITARQRRFFWAMYGDTGDKMWKCLALSTTYTIPARPYFRPAIAQAKGEAVEEMAQFVLSMLEKYAE